MSRATPMPMPISAKNQLANSCGPCMTPAQIKKRNEQDVKELKETINHLVKHGYHSDEMFNVVGVLTMKLIQIHGPLK